jgi:putative membrane protein
VKHPATWFNDEDRARINSAVAAAEARASVEIVPAVAASSGRYDRAEDLVGLWAGVFAMAVVWFFLPREPAEPGTWGGMSAGLQLAMLVLAVVLGFVVGALLASRIDWLRSMFTPAAQKQAEVCARARQVFFDKRVHHSSRGNGLLIYVSGLERMAAVLADHVVIEKLGQPAIDELCRQLTDRLRRERPAEAISATIQLAGDRLSAVLPRGVGEANEFPDALVVLA